MAFYRCGSGDSTSIRQIIKDNGYTDLFIKDGKQNVVLQEKTVTPDVLPAIYIPDTEVDGISKLTINSPESLIPENIKEGINIFGVNGALESEGLYVWKKLSAQGGDFIDYVVSDNKSKYPDGDVHTDGYYYEAVSDKLEITNGMVVSLPAYQEDIKSNTFVSIASNQYDKDTLLVNMPDIAKVNYNTQRCASYRLDETHMIVIWAEKDYVYARILTRFENGTYEVGEANTLLQIGFTSYAYGGGETNHSHKFVKTDDNYFIWIVNQNVRDPGAPIKKSAIVTFRVTENYDIDIIRAISSQDSAFTFSNHSISSSIDVDQVKLGIQYIDYIDGHRFFIRGYDIKFTYNRFYTRVIGVYELAQDGSLTEVALIESSNYNPADFVYIGTVDNGMFLLCNLDAESTDMYSFSGTGFTQVASLKMTIAGPSGFISIGNSRYLVVSSSYNSSDMPQYVRLLTVTADSLKLDTTLSVPFGYSSLDIYSNTIVWDEEVSTLYVMYSGVTASSPLYSVIVDLENNTLTLGDNVDYTITSYSGAWLISSGRVEGVANDCNSGLDIRGIGLWNFNALTDCVRNSLDTNAISGVAMTTCTHDKPGKVCLLNDGTAVSSVYGISEAVVTNIVDDSVDAIKEEVTSNANS